MDDWILTPWGRLGLLAAAAALIALVAHRILRPIVLRLTRRSRVLDSAVRATDKPLQALMPLVALLIVWQGAPDDLRFLEGVRHLTGVLMIGTATWTLIAAARGAAEGVIALHPANVEDNLQARRIHTQTRVLSRIAVGVIGVAGLAFILMSFPAARQYGASLLASAGVAGLVIGLAAQSVVGNLLAGLQIALAQPIRIDDVLIVEGEWGRVEEITATYVVLRIWDERRLVVPLKWFIENPFQNWTRNSASLLGTVFLWVDYTLPVEPIRAEAERLCKTLSEWDGRVCVVQVTETTERTMQLRILVSAADSGRAFDLRCKLREGLVAFIAREHPHALPRVRGDVTTTGEATPGALPTLDRADPAATAT